MEAFVGLNDITDAFEALPLDVVRYFTLLKEIDAKCAVVNSNLDDKISRFRKGDNQTMTEIVRLLKEVLPCLEEKMHVAGLAVDTVVGHLGRIDQDFELVKKEVPQTIQFGPVREPAIVVEGATKAEKSAQTQKSESRREAIAAKRALSVNAQASNGATNGPAAGASSTGGATASSRERTPTTSGKRPRSKRKPEAGAAGQAGSSTGAGGAAHGGSGAAGQAGSGHASGSGAAGAGAGASSSTGAAAAGKSSTSQASGAGKEPLYCYCNQVSYGEMVGCDGEHCVREWFHLPCTGLSTLPRGKWYCDDCKLKN